MGRELDTKSKMILEICSLSTTAIVCPHRSHPCTNPVNKSSRFIDWYRILALDENADLETIKKRYHKLALQLHPDKNKHPKAEIAFKLVLEGYSCLSDNVKRERFDLERWKNFCIQCNRIPYTPCNSNFLIDSSEPKPNKWSSSTRSRSQQVYNLREVRERMKEEAEVIAKCLRPSRREESESPIFNPSGNLFENNNGRLRPRKESPIFNPSDYFFQGYPHVRSRHAYKKHEDHCHWQGRSVLSYGRVDSPIFENRSQREMFKSKSACVHS